MLELLTAEDLLGLLQVSRKTLYNHVAIGRLPAPLRIGRRRYWPRAVIETALLHSPKVCLDSLALSKDTRRG